LGPGRPSWRRWRDNEDVLRSVNFAVRVALLVIVGVVVFASRWPGAPYVAVEIAALVVATGVLAVRVPSNWLAPAHKHSVLDPYALGLMVVMCGVASATPRGGIFNILSFLAAVAVGSDLNFNVGLAVAGLGIVATAATGTALGAGAAVIAGYPVVQVLGFVFGRNLRANRLYAQQADRLSEQQARAAALDERARIAREIHDVLAHSLGALGLQIQLARAVLTDQHDQNRAVDILEQAQRMANEGLHDTRRAIQALRGETLPLPQGLAELSANHQRRQGTRVTFDVCGQPRPLSPDAELALSRTAQEALVNSAKHAPQEPVTVHLDYTDTDTTLTVSNPLRRNSTPERPRFTTVNGGYGLAGMRERLLLLDGTLSAGSSADDWVVMAKVPQ
jgi:signal transduction histidine kinase